MVGFQCSDEGYISKRHPSRAESSCAGRFGEEMFSKRRFFVHDSVVVADTIVSYPTPCVSLDSLLRNGVGYICVLLAQGPKIIFPLPFVWFPMRSSQLLAGRSGIAASPKLPRSTSLAG